MSETPPPPGWPNKDPHPAPPPAPPSFEPSAQPPPPPGAPQFEPPTHPAPPASYPPPAPAASPYEPPVPNVPPANQFPPPNYDRPGQPPPPPGWAPPPPPPKKSSSKTIWITLAVIFGVIALGIGSCTVWFVGTVKAPVDESNRFLAAIDSGDYNAAVAMTDPGCNFGLTVADLDSLFGRRDITYDLKSSSVVNSDATVSGSFSADGLGYNNIQLSLRNRSGWQVCGFNVS